MELLMWSCCMDSVKPVTIPYHNFWSLQLGVAQSTASTQSSLSTRVSWMASELVISE